MGLFFRNICIFAVCKQRRYMATLDVILLIIIGLGVLLGFLRGALKQLAGLLGLVVGLLAAKVLYASVAERVFSHVTDNLTVAQVLSFVAIWVAVPLLFWLVAALLTKMMEAVSLGWLNRLLGAVLGGLLHALVLSLLVCVLEVVDTDDVLLSRSQKRQSVLYDRLKPLAGLFLPAAQEFTRQIYNEINDATERI